eukprot:g13562.t1 g13562   contig82:14183-14878(+)
MCGMLNVDVTLAYADDTDELAEGSADDPATSGRSTLGAVVASSTQVGILRGVGPPGHLTDFKWTISGRSDSNYAADIDDRRSVTGCRTFLNGAPVMFRSATQRFVTLSVTEAESAAGVTETQDMLYAYNILKSLGLKVELPMILEMDNKGAVDLANSWSVGGRTRHIDVRMHFLRELKSQGLLVIKHVPGDDNDADIFTKNTTAAVFNKHVRNFVGNDEYVEVEVQDNPPS